MSAPQTKTETTATLQIKICGITTPDDAMACTALGADAVGLVFYPQSPRYVTAGRAADISTALPPAVARVGVFVNEPFDTIMDKVETCGLTAVQLHGQESAAQVRQLSQSGVRVIKALFINKAPLVETAPKYTDAAAFLVECAGGKLPGGNATTWDWAAARPFVEHYPTVLAGGLCPENAASAIDAACPDAVDISSGVEASPGQKDYNKVQTFVHTVRAYT
ncbi:MAG: phosphoribosylanthranilate isomerase, partial [Thermodesulfobacteriota bacterium]